MENAKGLSVITRILAGLMLIIAVFDLPYSYYQVLRIVICASSIFLCWYFVNAKIEWLGWLYIIPAILFNPVFPVYMDKSNWVVIDMIFGVFFLMSLVAINKEADI